MSFSRANSLGWALYEVLTSAQMNALDIDHANAVDGAAGGTYTPSSPVIFGADKLQATPYAGDINFNEAYTDHASYTDNRIYSLSGADLDFKWEYGNGFLMQTDVDAGNQFFIFKSFKPFAATLTAVAVRLQPDPGHTNLPATMPKLTVEYVVGQDTLLSFGSKTDDSDLATYNTPHWLTATGSVQIYFTNLFRIKLEGESGTNSRSGMIAIGLTTTSTVTRNYPG